MPAPRQCAKNSRDLGVAGSADDPAVLLDDPEGVSISGPICRTITSGSTDAKASSGLTTDRTVTCLRSAWESGARASAADA
jgi:hypothetical protein